MSLVSVPGLAYFLKKRKSAIKTEPTMPANLRGTAARHRTVAKYTPEARIRAIERKVATLHPPELKYEVFNFTPGTIAPGGFAATPIFQGITMGSWHGNRIGDDIRVHSIEIRGDIARGWFPTDIYLVKPTNPDALPDPSEFNQGAGGFYLPHFGWEAYHHTLGGANSDNEYVGFKYTFKRPMKVTFNQSTAATTYPNNEMFFVAANKSTGSITGGNVHVKIYYTDA